MTQKSTVHPRITPPIGRDKRGARLAFLDWTRGLAAAIMLQGHTFHNFMKPDLRESGPFVISQFIGGLTPAIFLFLTGVTFGFMMDGFEKKGMPPAERIPAALRRAGYLFVLAFAFRLQLWAFWLGASPWTDLLKVDILNCMGMGMAVLSVLSVLSTRERARTAFVTGLIIACCSPLIAMNDQNSIPNILAMYFVPDYRYFSFFPWASFIAFGLGAGSIIRLVPDHLDHVMQWFAIIGIGLIVAAQYFSNQPYSLYPATEYWLNSPGLILVKLGVILSILPIAFLWNQYAPVQRWSWIRQLGTTSLLVYWVHIELVYGRWFGFWREKLDVQHCTVLAVVLTLLMIALSTIRSKLKWHELGEKLRMGDAQPARTR